MTWQAGGAWVSVTRGSDVTATITLPTTGGPFDLTGWTVGIFEPTSALGDNISVAVVDAAAGIVRVRIEWANSYTAGTVHSFRIQASQGQENVGWPAITVGYV
jgi:hypothetical protein